MIARWWRCWAGVVCVLGLGVAAAPLTEAEKQLLNSSMSASTAEEYGKASDAAGLERIIAIGDPDLVRTFDTGMQRSRIEVMPPAVEALVVKHFDDPRVGTALRGMQPRYQARALFDLHYARLKATYRSDEPSFQQILRTDQPGVDEPLLQIAARFPVGPYQFNAALTFVGMRKHASAVPALLATLGANKDQPTGAVYLLANYPSAEVWRQTLAQLDRLRGEGRLTEGAYGAARRQIDPLLANPDVAIARLKGQEELARFAKKRDALVPQAALIEPLKKSAPRQYVEQQARYLEQLDAIAAETGDEGAYQVAVEYGRLGLFTRFLLREPALAMRFLEKSAKGHDLIGQVALADTFQFEMRDTAAAIRAYQQALATASEPKPRGRNVPYGQPGTSMNEFWKAWLAEEIEYLRTGKPFQARVAEPVIRGFWEAMGVWKREAVPVFPEWPAPMTYISRLSAAGAAGPVIAARRESELKTLDRNELPARLARVPASRLALFITLRFISAAPDADTTLRELKRNDPSGYWTTLALGTVAFYEGRGDAGRDEASRNGLVDAMPGMLMPERPNVLATAAQRYLKESKLGPVEKKP